MLTSKFRSLLEEFHRKKWFPETYPDPYGEFGDYISEGMISDLFLAWQKEKRGSYLDVARYILQLLPEIQFRDVFLEYRKALLDPLSENVLPEFAFYWIRNSGEESGSRIWNELQKWSDRWESVFFEWMRSILRLESNHGNFEQTYKERLRLPEPGEDLLRGSRELFEWQLLTMTKARNYEELLRFFELEPWSNAAQWNHLPALGKSVAEACGIPQLPTTQASQNPALQYLFPVAPPSRILLEHGRATGPVDAMRFLIELGKGFFYGGMNPDLPAEERICGDPSLPWFWGFTFASLLADPEGVKTFIGLKAETMPEHTGLVLESWTRQELFMAIYRSRSATDLEHVQDRYEALWKLSFPVEPPSFLCLYDLCRSTDSIFRWAAFMRSQTVIKYLRSKYGRRWFMERKWTQRAREYWWEGYRLTTSDILNDLQIPLEVKG